MVAGVLLVLLSGYYGFPVVSTIVLSLVIVGLSYIVGDIGILRVSNNTVATLADLGLTTFAIWIIGPFLYGVAIHMSIAFVVALIISAGEWFFHKYVATAVFYKEPSAQK